MPIWNRRIQAKNSLKNRIWEGRGLPLGKVWDGLGRLLGALGRLLAVFRALKIELFKALVQDGLQDAFWINFGKVLEGFGKGLGRDLGGFRGFWAGYGQILEAFGEIWPCWGRFYN